MMEFRVMTDFQKKNGSYDGFQNYNRFSEEKPTAMQGFNVMTDFQRKNREL